jgi:uncharacterized membrane protein
MIARKRHAVKALEVGGWELSAKLLLYYLHERFWYRFIGLGVGGAEAK